LPRGTRAAGGDNMVKRSTWVMIVVLAILAGLAYYLQQPDNLIKKAFANAGGTPTAETFGTLISPADGPINGVSIQSADGQSVTLERKSSDWALSINGSATATDQVAAEQAASQSQGLRIVARIDTPNNLSAFGLDKPAYIYKLILADGKSATFKIGNSTITGSGYYLQKEDGTVVIVDKYGMDLVLNLLTQPPYKFTPTPSSVPLTETPTPSGDATGTTTPIAELTATKQP
jgi:hypothetical protein